MNPKFKVGDLIFFKNYLGRGPLTCLILEINIHKRDSLYAYTVFSLEQRRQTRCWNAEYFENRGTKIAGKETE